MADISKEQAVRDAFEKHWLDTRGKKKAFKELQRHTLQPQCYVQDSANRHWVTWQAAFKLGRNAGLEEAKQTAEECDVVEAKGNTYYAQLGDAAATQRGIVAAIESLKDNTP